MISNYEQEGRNYTSLAYSWVYSEAQTTALHAKADVIVELAGKVVTFAGIL